MTSLGQNAARAAQDLSAMLTDAVKALQAKRPSDAAQLAQRALKIAPDNAACHLVMATASQNLGRDADAERHYKQCLRIDARNMRALTNLGMLQLNAERADEAVDTLERAIALDPGALEARHFLARAYGMCGRYEDAITEFEWVARKSPASADVLKGLGKALSAAQRVGESIEVLEKAHAITPDDPVVSRGIGVAHAALGDFEQAERWLREAVRRGAAETDAFLQLGVIKRLTDSDIEAIEAEIEARSRAPDPKLACLCYALGAFLDRRGDAERAFAAIARANAIIAERTDFDHQRMRLHYERMAEATDRVRLAMPPHGSNSDKLVFIVGMPRSGTTLVETVLAGHPAVFAAGERETMPEFAAALARQQPDQLLNISDLGGEELRYLAQLYLDQLPPAAAAALRVTDKLPGNTANLPFIARLFPNARFILCRRHPMDVAWSIFKSSFAGITYATSLQNIAAQQQIVCGFMDRWIAEMPERSLEVLYEELVGEFEAGARRIVSFCGLDWNDACLQPDMVGRTVRTASVWQVRQPVFTSSIGQWRRYEKQLADTRERMSGLIDSYEARLAPST